MNKYDFDTVISRRKTDSVKWSRYPEDVLPLWVADMDFPSPPVVTDAINKRLAHPFFGYAGEDKQLIETICNWVEDRHMWKIEPEWVVLMPGVVTGMNWTAQTFVKPEMDYVFTLLFTRLFSIFLSVMGLIGLRSP